MGRFTLRLPETLHQELESRARQEGVSLNQYVVYALTRQVAPTCTIELLPDEAVKRQKTRFANLLATLGKPSPTETAAFLAEREVVPREGELAEETIAGLEAKLADSAG